MTNSGFEIILINHQEELNTNRDCKCYFGTGLNLRNHSTLKNIKHIRAQGGLNSHSSNFPDEILYHHITLHLFQGY